MILKDEREIENSFHPRLVKQNCSWGSGWCDSRSFNVQFDIKLDTSTTAGRVKSLVCTQCHSIVTILCKYLCQDMMMVPWRWILYDLKRVGVKWILCDLNVFLINICIRWLLLIMLIRFVLLSNQHTKLNIRNSQILVIIIPYASAQV